MSQIVNDIIAFGRQLDIQTRVEPFLTLRTCFKLIMFRRRTFPVQFFAGVRGVDRNADELDYCAGHIEG